MGTRLEWLLLMSVMCLLRLLPEGEGASRVVLKLDFECLPQKETHSLAKFLGPDCHTSITYQSGQGKLPSVSPSSVAVGYFWDGKNVTKSFFNFTVECHENTALYHQRSESSLMFENKGNHIFQDTIHTHIKSQRFHRHKLVECVSLSGSNNNHISTSNGLELQCGTKSTAVALSTAFWSTESTLTVQECNGSNSPCVKNFNEKRHRSDLKGNLLHSLPQTFQCHEQITAIGLNALHNFTVQTLNKSNLPEQQLPTHPAPSTTEPVHTSDSASHVAHVAHVATADQTTLSQLDDVSVPNSVNTHSNTLMVALSASAAGATALVVIVLLIMWFRHHRKQGNQTSTVQVAANLFRLPRRLRPRSNNYVGRGDRLLSEMEETTLPRAMRRYGTSSLHYSDQWEINRAHITQLATAGEGCYGRVLDCELAPSGDSNTPYKVAVKTTKRSSDKMGLQELVTEALAMRRVGNDQNILKLLGVCTRGGPLWLVMEYAPFGNLRHYLRSRRPDNDDPLGVVSVPPGSDAIVMTEERLLRYSSQIANGMKYLISKECLHCNLCARSVLVFDNDTLKLSNFGVVKERDYATYYNEAAPALATVKWQSPETFLCQEHSEYSDVWSFGILMWEVATLGGTPYPGVAVESLRDLIIYSAYRMQRPRNCSRRVYSLMTSCWTISPHQRPKFVVLAVKLARVLSEIESENVQASAVEAESNEVNGESSGQAG